MTIDERRIAEELRTMAGEAAPVDPVLYVTRTLARRRRRAWSVAGFAGLAAAAAVVTAVIVPLPDGLGPGTAAGVATLPANTPEQARFVRECMPKGGPVHNMDGNRRIAEHGRADDFRVLVEYRDEGGSTALVGSDAGFVLCTPTEQRDMAERPVFTYWGFEPPGDLAGFSGDLQVDAYTSHTHSYTVGAQRIQRDDVYRVVTGRVSDAVRRVEVDWADGRRTAARIANGFFIVRVIGRPVREPGEEEATVLDSPPVTVTAYGDGGQVLRQEKDVAFGPLGRGSG
ncbi:unnamed protein product [[Actinomadura] parvosata subsp. kistnae]|uniref:Uncharacterized protein n=1 Tax=[Actinomadura] parvosata subsp. kistnae TaxID=1909395 RepID=A0A1V0AB53_9ACTN|nr:hypothetical protein [Nonomuraea sp. ATCC 55076]AQZ67450.1 hypothetical protein BKM31_43685 [Nonomuraea sp. ATCC 55076]SPL94297.1 unnamed protein product [Actinomadura parvosata subsp. kistnae]